jgi:hypothetical protein
LRIKKQQHAKLETFWGVSFFWAVLGFELFLGRHSTTWAVPPALIILIFYFSSLLCCHIERSNSGLCKQPTIVWKNLSLWCFQKELDVESLSLSAVLLEYLHLFLKHWLMYWIIHSYHLFCSTFLQEKYCCKLHILLHILSLCNRNFNWKLYISNSSLKVGYFLLALLVLNIVQTVSTQTGKGNEWVFTVWGIFNNYSHYFVIDFHLALLQPNS